MKALRLFSLLVGLLILGVVAITAFLSPDFRVERRIVIDASKSGIFQHLSDLKAWESWSPWMTLDPEMSLTYSDVTNREGAFYYWNGQRSGEGTLTLTQIAPHDHIRYRMEFKGYDFLTPEGIVELISLEENRTEVRWIFEGSVEGEYFMRWFSAFTDSRLGPVFEKGLQGLKTVSEEQTLLPLAG